MTKFLDRAIEKARRLPDDRQDEVGEAILEMLEDTVPEPRLTEAQVAEVRRRLANPASIASEEDVEKLFRSLA